MVYHTSCVATISEPSTYDEALNSQYSQQWISAIKEEIKSLEENQTWALVEKPALKNIVGCKWVFKIKSSPNNDPPNKDTKLDW